MPTRYRVDDLVVDVGVRRVTRDGVELSVAGLSFDLMLALVRAAPNLVTFDALMALVWRDVVVSPETLTQRVKLLRHALGDDAGSPRYILAVRGHGYRLAMPASLAPEPDRDPREVPSAERRSKFRPQSTPRPWPRLAAAVLLAAAAVLAWWFGRPTTIGPAASSEAAAPLPPTRDVDAYRFYLQAESVVNGTAESFVAAIALYDEALRRDPDFARALAGRAMNRAALVWTGSTLARGLEDAQRDAARALELEPGNVDTQLVLASIGALLGDWTAAEAGFRAAIAANPVSAGAHGRYAVGLLLPTGQLRKAAAEAEEALRLAPSDGFSASMLSLVEQASGADSDAVRSADLALSRGADARAMETVYASAAARSGHYAEAAEHAIKSFPPAIRDAGGVPTMQLAFSALADAEKRSAALDALRKLRHETAWERLDPRSKQPVFYVYGALGAVDDLYDEMSQSLRRDGGEYPEIITIATLWSPELRTFRRDPRFQALAERLGLIAYWSAFGSPDDCSVTAGKLNCN